MGAPGGPGLVRTPWPGVAVSTRQLLDLFEHDRLRPETEAFDVYRAARLTPEGLAALGPDGYTTLGGARSAALEGCGGPETEPRAVTVCRGLPADVTRLDGRPFESGRERIAPGPGSGVEWVDPSGAGVPVVDGNGDGFVLGRSCLVRVAGGLIAEPGAELASAPAWIYRAFAKLKVEPLTPHVHGVVVRVSRGEAETWGLPDGTKAVLLLRGRRRGSVAWRCLDGDAFKSLRAEDGVCVSPREGLHVQLPVGADAGQAGGGQEAGPARGDDGG